MYNHNLAQKATCYTYLAEYWTPTQWDENYGWGVVKYDDCTKKIAAKWSEPGHVCQEPRFIPNPNAKKEDDGVIMCQGYDFNNQKSKLLVIDPKSMKTLNEWQLPFRIPIGIHSNYWPKTD